MHRSLCFPIHRSTNPNLSKVYEGIERQYSAPETKAHRATSEGIGVMSVTALADVAEVRAHARNSSVRYVVIDDI